VVASGVGRREASGVRRQPIRNRHIWTNDQGHVRKGAIAEALANLNFMVQASCGMAKASRLR